MGQFFYVHGKNVEPQDKRTSLKQLISASSYDASRSVELPQVRSKQAWRIGEAVNIPVRRGRGALYPDSPPRFL
jgi:hypothetical protein